MAIIGIDLGTTNSLACVYRNGKTELIPNRFGSFLTPSAVSVLEDNSVIVGEPAKERKTTHPDTTVLSFKKDMGSEKKYKLGNHSFLPEELSSFIISSLVNDAKEYLGEEIEEAVISVPAYFHDKQRAATKRAGRLAGITVNRILNEPSAAALASYKDQQDLKKFLVFDLGGGTLDVSVVACIHSVVEILAVSGNNHLGGDDFDQMMADSFLKEHKINRKKITDKEYAILVKKAEHCKRKLTMNDTSAIHMTIHNTPYTSEYNMKRLMAESKDLLQQIRTIIGAALKDSNTKVSEIEEIIMVGGSSKMPLIQSYVRHLFHKQPVIRTNCDEMIALGLGIFCGGKEKQEQGDEYVLMDICPFSLGTAIHNPSNLTKLFNSIIIPRNHVLPCTKVSNFTTVTNMQKQIRFKILQGENMYADDNLLLDEVIIPVTPLPAGEEDVMVRFTYDINGILMIDFQIKSTGEKKRKIISDAVSEEELEERCKELEMLKTNPADLSENRLILDRLETLYNEISPQYKDFVKDLMVEFIKVLQTQSPSAILKCRSKIIALLPKYEKADPFAEVAVLNLDDMWEDPWNDLNDDDSFFESDLSNDSSNPHDKEKKKETGSKIDWLKFYHFDDEMPS